MLTFKQLIDLNNAYIDFCEYEYGQAEPLVDFSRPVQTISREVLPQMIDIAYTDDQVHFILWTMPSWLTARG